MGETALERASIGRRLNDTLSRIDELQGRYAGL